MHATHEVLSPAFCVLSYDLLRETLDLLLDSVHLNIFVWGPLLEGSCLWIERAVLDEGLL